MGQHQNFKNRRFSSLIISEALLISYILYITFYVVKFLDPAAPDLDTSYIPFIVTFTFFILMSSLSLGLYEPKLRESIRGIVRRVFVANGLAFFAMYVITIIFFREILIHPYYFVVSIGLSITSVSVFRFFMVRYGSLGLAKSRIVILGAGERASTIEQKMRRASDRRSFDVVGFIPVAGDDMENGIKKEPVLEIDIENSLKAFVVENEINEVVIAADQRRGTLPIEVLFDCRMHGVQISDLLDFMERETGQIMVNLMYPSWLIYSKGFESQSYLRQIRNYSFNVFLATLVLLFVWPFMLLTALIIYVDHGRKTGASVFYKQVRVGKNGEPFSIYKFRSMGIDAEKNGAQWADKNDVRVTRVGGFIRKYRLDELPQLYNVFKGDMSFVGPRPERPEFVEQLEQAIPFYSKRHNVKPGLAGWAQLNYPYGASIEDAEGKLKYDLYYVKHQSFLLDILVLIRTIEVVLFGKGQ